jgi:predicted acyltransferase
MGYAVGISFRNVWKQEKSTQFGKFLCFKIKEPHAKRLNLAYKIIKRTVLLFIIGFLLNLFANRFQKVRIPGVLQRISLCYFIVAVIYVSVPSVMFGTIIIFVLQVIYLIIMFSLDVPGCGRAVITPECNASGYIDRLILGKKFIFLGGPYDPEGIVSTLTAALTTWLGVVFYKLAEYVKSQSKSEQWPEGKYENRVALYFVFSGVSLMIVSLIIHIGFPLNKPIWSPSFAIFMPGCAGNIIV